MANEIIELKRGDAFTYMGDLPEALSGPDVTAISQVRTLGNVLLADVVVTLDSGVLYLEHDDTSNWPLGPVKFDVRFKINGKVQSTYTVILSIIEEVSDRP